MIVRQANPESRWGFHNKYQYCFIINGDIWFNGRPKKEDYPDDVTTIGVFNDQNRTNDQ